MNVLIEGQLMNLYRTSDYYNKDTGETKQGKFKLQLMSNTVLVNGETRNELFDVSIPDERVPMYKDKVGEVVTVKCGMISKGAVTFYGV